ncbi:MAG: bifunctional phosphoglucose/phosphomannose isomerase [Acidobacteriota bacterium]
MSSILDDPSALVQSDPGGMSAILASFGRQLEEARDLDLDLKMPSVEGIQNILICGMGGSAIGGDFLRAYLGADLPIPLYVNRHSTLPGFAGPSTLAFICSYSGNTRETLSAFHEARKVGCRIICWTSNGRLLELAREQGLSCIRVPAGLPPRTSLAYSTVPLLRVLARLGWVSDPVDQVDGALNGVRNGIEAYRIESPVAENAAKQLALKVHGKIPLIYGSQDRLDVMATRWRGQFAENGKQLSYSSALPEMNHNEIVGWKHPSDVMDRLIPIFLRDQDDHPEIQLRIELTKEVLSQRVETVLEYRSQGESWMERLWSLTLLGDYSSLYLAFLNQENPVSVETIDAFKAALSRQLGDQ